jgi:hypothetical protein
MINVDYSSLKTFIKGYYNSNRCESAAFLAWYLVNFYRLDEAGAIFCICDERGDKGVDGIYINEAVGTIDIFQCKLSRKVNTSIGDKLLKEFFGTLSQFENKEKIEHIINSAGNAQLVSILKRLEILNIIDNYEIRGIFISNINIDPNGESYLKITPRIKFIGKKDLESTFISDSKTIKTGIQASFNITGFKYAKYSMDDKIFAVIAPVLASELVKLNGIEDQSLFDFNVRGPLGNTQVNKDIVKSIRDKSAHKGFPLFHNGITIISDKVIDSVDKIDIETYYVVNGCQSLTALFNNKKHLTDDLRILTKFVQIAANTLLSKVITNHSNNQNGVKPRDFRSNHSIQVRLQKDMDVFYGNEFFFEIKKGETAEGKTAISNEDAGINLWAFDLEEPWNVHRRYQVFEDKYLEIFARPEVTSDRIVLLQILNEIIIESIDKIENESFAKYSITRYAILYILKSILKTDTIGQKVIEIPENFVRDKDTRSILINAVRLLINDILIDVNGDVEDYGEHFDYRSMLRDENRVKELRQRIATSYQKLTSRGRIKTFTQDYTDLESASKIENK